MTGVPSKATRTAPPAGIAISILAGGLSSRMGRDKARMRLGRWTLLSRVRKIAHESGLPVRIIRRDLVPRCGPMGGIYTALKTSHAKAQLFLACDMPFVPAALVRGVVKRSLSGRKPVFTICGGTAGFPMLIPAHALHIIEKQIQEEQWSLRALASRLRAAKVILPMNRAREVFNVNSPEDWRQARAFLSRRVRAVREIPC